MQDKTVRGQYAAGRIGGQEVPAYYFEKNVDNDSDTETFVALQAEVENWRWAGVPFYLRTGKRMARKCSEIVIQLKPVPHSLSRRRRRAGQPPVDKVAAGGADQRATDGQDPGARACNWNRWSWTSTWPRPSAATSALGRLRAPAAGRDRGRLDAVHAPRRGRGRLGLGRPESSPAWREHYQSPRPYPAGSNGPEQAQLLLELQGRRWLE